MITLSVDRHPELPRGVRYRSGRRLAALDMLPAAVNVIAECLCQAEMLEMAAYPAVELDEATAFGRPAGKRQDELDRADHRAQPLREARARLCSFSRSWNSGGS